MTMRYKILHRESPETLTVLVNSYIDMGGWKPIGGHQVVTLNMTNRISGNQIHGSNYEVEYSQTMINEEMED